MRGEASEKAWTGEHSAPRPGFPIHWTVRVAREIQPSLGKSTGWVCGAILILMGTGAVLSIAGRESLVLVKVAIYLLLGPAVVLAPVAVWWISRQQQWYRSAALISLALFAVGTVLFLVPLLAWMPWAPARFAMENAPLLVRAGVFIGGSLVVGSVFLGTGHQVVEAWRTREWPRVLAFVFIACLMGWAIAGRWL